MDLADFNYDLPDDLIARYPVVERSSSRLLVLGSQGDPVCHAQFRNLGEHLSAGDLLVVNDTRVIPARFFAHKDSGGRVEVLVERIVNAHTALVHAKASKPLQAGRTLHLDGGHSAAVAGRAGELYSLSFSGDVEEYLRKYGQVPLPPYLGRAPDADDRERYQTIFARKPGAVAAPTAGLHFDRALTAALSDAGIETVAVTLHVGAGTFQNLRPDQLETGRLHAERVVVGQAACDRIAATQAGGGRVIAVGTTSARALESAARAGVLQPMDGETDLFIMPGYKFRAIDGLVTNFHLPGSSLLLLVAAVAGANQVMSAYREAIRLRYRFYSYGDAMLAWCNGDRDAL